MADVTTINGTDQIADSRAVINTNFDNLNDDKLELSGGTMTGQLNFSGTDHAGIKLLSLTTAERDALAAANGMMIYNSTTAELQGYEDGGWISLESGVADATAAVKGIVEIATDAELSTGAAAASGDTSADLVAHAASFNETAAATKVPVADGSGKLGADWGGAASSLATLDGSTLVVENPANATATPTASKIVIADATGKINEGWMGLTTAGDVMYSDGTDVQRLAIGTAGQVVETNSGATAPQWATRANVIAVDDADVTVGNTTTETDLFSVAIPANTLGSTGGVWGRLFISNHDQSNTRWMKIVLKYGATTLKTMTGTANTTFTGHKGYIDFYLVADGATNAQIGWMSFLTSGAGWGTNGSQCGPSFNEGTAAEDSTGALNLAITADFQNALASDTITMGGYIIYKALI